MTERVIPNCIIGAASIAHELGEWPSFHDAEVVSLKLFTAGESELVIRLVAPKQHENIRIKFLMREIAWLELEDFSQQNVIYCLLAKEVDGLVRVSLEPCYGLSGHLDAHSVSAEIVR